MKTYYTGLVGDVGGTNARLALVDSEGHIRHTAGPAEAGASGLFDCPETTGSKIEAVA